MKSNLIKIYESKKEIDFLNEEYYGLRRNPFYEVNNFIYGIDKNLNKNYLDNLQDLKVLPDYHRDSLCSYDYENNIAYSKGGKADAFVLFHVASNDRTKENTGVIDSEGNGYGLNTGITELFTYKVNNISLMYQVETFMAEIMYCLYKDELANSYFNNNSNILKSANPNINDVMLYLDQYHDNYIKLISLNRSIFSKERFYYNQVYGDTLKEKDDELNSIYESIYKLESANITYCNSLLDYIIKMIEKSNISQGEKLSILLKVKNTFTKITSKEDFDYLSEVNNNVLSNMKRLVK